MSLRHALLGALAHEQQTGYGLLKHFQQSLAYAWPASHSQIYPELARLLEDGLIEQTASGARGSKTYAVTPAGREEIRRWLRETEPDRRVRNDAALRIFFLWLLEPDEAASRLEDELAYSRGILDEFERIRDEPTGSGRKAKAFRIALEGGIRSVEARLDWLDWAVEQVRSPAWRNSPEA